MLPPPCDYKTHEINLFLGIDLAKGPSSYMLIDNVTPDPNYSGIIKIRKTVVGGYSNILEPVNK